MNPLAIVGLLAFMVFSAILLIRYVNATVDKEFRSLARAVSDKEFRADELSRAELLLTDALPLPNDIKPLPGPSGGLGLLPPALLALGVVMLWGGVFAREEKSLWVHAGIGAALLAAVIMLITLRRRRWERVARLLRFRADLRRIDGDHKGSVADLHELLKLTPWDDAAWAELSDDLAATGALDDALEAIRQASRLDRRYDEYHMLQASLAIRLGRLDEARDAIRDWEELDNVRADDPRLVIYRAALELAEGKQDAAALSLKGILLDENAMSLEFLDTDQALAGVRHLLPGRENEDTND